MMNSSASMFAEDDIRAAYESFKTKFREMKSIEVRHKTVYEQSSSSSSSEEDDEQEKLKTQQ